jgi:cyclopropane-fatty-acyl-phospholipid synthase
MFPLSRLMTAFVQVGKLTITDAKGREHIFGGRVSGPEARMQLHDKSLYHKIFFNPELHAGEAYMDGRLTFDGSSLREFLTLFSVNRLSIGGYPLQKFLKSISIALKRFQQSNPTGKAQQNVSHHYDIGNDLYTRFLDADMQYSCAYFIEPTDTLEMAQRNKQRLLAAKMQLAPGHKVLDIGCGWGGMALYLAAMHDDIEVLGVTLSQEQYELANRRAEAAGLSDRVRFDVRDYREVSEKFDRIVSVGMFEHVGVHHYPEFFRKLDDLMTDDGLSVVHSIGHMSPPGTASPWLRKYIFPGAYSPALSEVFTAIEQQRLWVTDLEFLRVHYADTLKEWTRRYEANRDEIKSAYDEKFCRMWEFYLVSAEMMFRTGNQLVFHMQIAKERRAAPLTRDYITHRQQELKAQEAARLEQIDAVSVRDLLKG